MAPRNWRVRRAAAPLRCQWLQPGPWSRGVFSCSQNSVWWQDAGRAEREGRALVTMMSVVLWEEVQCSVSGFVVDRVIYFPFCLKKWFVIRGNLFVCLFVCLLGFKGASTTEVILRPCGNLSLDLRHVCCYGHCDGFT